MPSISTCLVEMKRIRVWEPPEHQHNVIPGYEGVHHPAISKLQLLQERGKGVLLAARKQHLLTSLKRTSSFCGRVRMLGPLWPTNTATVVTSHSTCPGCCLTDDPCCISHWNVTVARYVSLWDLSSCTVTSGFTTESKMSYLTSTGQKNNSCGFE